MHNLDTIPSEVLDHIAYSAASLPPTGPPVAIRDLLLVNRRISAALSFKANPHLYGNIFTAKFDVAAIVRRTGSVPTHTYLAAELRRRFVHLQRIRARTDSLIQDTADHDGVRDVLWTAYAMMLEDDGKNERQLREYAHLGKWLQEFWFHDYGASLLKTSIAQRKWPSSSDNNTLAMWLFWRFIKTGTSFTTIHLPLTCTRRLPLRQTSSRQSTAPLRPLSPTRKPPPSHPTISHTAPSTPSRANHGPPSTHPPHTPSPPSQRPPSSPTSASTLSSAPNHSSPPPPGSPSSPPAPCARPRTAQSGTASGVGCAGTLARHSPQAASRASGKAYSPYLPPTPQLILTNRPASTSNSHPTRPS